MTTLRYALPVVIAVVLAPLVAAVPLFLLIFGDEIVRPTGKSWSDLLGLLVVSVGITYYIGGLIGLIGGLLVSVSMLWRPPNLMTVNVAAIVACGAYFLLGALGLLDRAHLVDVRGDSVFMLGLAVIAATVCWFASRRLFRSDRNR
jgi:hypothetical protein